MDDLTIRKKMLLLSSYTPRRCGIATFTEDLIKSIASVFGDSLPLEVCALQARDQNFEYGNEVSYILQTSELNEYRKLAEKINNRSDIGLVCIQHEFGLFGGEYGDRLLSLLLALNKPILTVFHTVLPNPEERRLKIVQAIIELSDHIIVLTKWSKELLIHFYSCLHSRITIIPHGTHRVLLGDKDKLKEAHGYNDRIVLSNFGLLSENKGIEKVLKALPEIIEKFPETLFLVIGKTHPEVFKYEGEKYRDMLKQIITALKLEDHVVFVDDFLALDELLAYICMSDVYLFSSKNPLQTVSGTFAYAMGCGCPVISTPIPHAVEWIANAGILLKRFDDSQEFKEAILHLIENKELRFEMGRRGYIVTQATSWANIAIQYGLIFGEMSDKMEDLKFILPPIKLDHIKKLTTPVGILQFSKLSQPDPDSGYTLDDNARALIYMVMYYTQHRDISSLKLSYTYLGFIESMHIGNGFFNNYMGYDGRFTPQNRKVDLEDANGRCLWSLGTVLGFNKILPMDMVLRAEILWKKSLQNVDSVKSPRAIAYSIKGLYQYYLTHPEEEVKNYTIYLADKLLHHYHLNARDNWHWYEDYVSYANNVLPEAMMNSYLITGNERYKEIAVVTFDFLLSHYFMKGQIKVVSKNVWFKKKNEFEFYGEQPIEVVTTIVALDLFYEVTGNVKYKNQLEIAFSWFLGNNHLNQVMYNTINGASYDGLEDKEVNINQGAESTLCFFRAQMIMEKYTKRLAVSFKNKDSFGQEEKLDNRINQNLLTKIQSQPKNGFH